MGILARRRIDGPPDDNPPSTERGSERSPDAGDAPRGLPKVWQHLGRTWKAYVATLGLVSAIFAGVDNVSRIHGLLFRPSALMVVMSGDINVAISDFRGTAAGDDARGTATSLAESLEDQLAETLSVGNGEELIVEVLGPGDVGRLAGDTPEERAEAARERAAELSAHVLVDGDLVQSEDESELRLSLYLSPSLLPNAEELVGQYELGQVASVTGDIARNPVLRKDLRDGVLRRVDALVDLIAALGYYSQDRFDEARAHLDKVAAAGNDALPDGGALVHLMQGNVALRSERLDDAETHYKEALELQPDYARAYVGLAEVEFLRSEGNTGCMAGEVDVEGVREAVASYLDAKGASGQPSVGDVAPKADFGLGRSLWCLSHTRATDDWSVAEGHFTDVVDEYESGNERIRELAAEAYAGLGLLYFTREDDLGLDGEAGYRAAIRSYERGIDITRRGERQGLFTGMVGDLQRRLGEFHAAAASYKRAASLDPLRAADYLSRLDTLPEQSRE